MIEFFDKSKALEGIKHGVETNLEKIMSDEQGELNFESKDELEDWVKSQVFGYVVREDYDGEESYLQEHATATKAMVQNETKHIKVRYFIDLKTQLIYFGSLEFVQVH